ncbi:uncharacterized protein LOC124260704 isoform X3 [Haliotis rubra]|uniref:uncharacterized protein LOC124260704 isoform X3 n=1 Tax=Haliotis rubra TaxID=36100 RepID=UPI001EE5A92B|nr:uncharacterized protein LOC124260704 isoform X3 [Haliotis rubra]
MGVTIETWRARIGLHSQPNKSQKTTTTQGMTTGGGSFSCRPRHILMVIGLLLLLSGNVELNPGPSSRRQQPPQQNNPSNRPYTNKDESFTTTEVLDILQNPDFSRVTTQPPVKPRAGQAFLYHFTDVNKRDDWRCDQYHFHHNATREQPKADPKFKKLFFVIKTREGKDKRFKKHAYIHLAEDNHLVLFQYIGDERIAEDLPHGNSKNASVPYIRLCPSVIRAIKDVSSNFTETLTSLNRQAATSDVPEVYKPRSRLHVMNTRYRGQKDCTKENHTNSLDKTGEPTLYNLAVALKKDTEVDKIVPEKGKRKKPKRLKNLQHIVRASSDFPDNQDNLRPTEDSHVMPVRNPKTPLDFRLVESNTALSTAGVDNTQVLHSETGETDHLHPLTCDGANVPQTISREKTDQGASEVVDFLKTILQDQCITSSNSISANAPSTHVKENELTFSSSEDGSCQITCQDNNKSNSDIAVQASGKETPALVENDNSENTQPASLENFIHAIVNDGRLGKIFQLLHQIQSTWNVSQQQSYCQHRADEHWAFEHEASAHRSSGNSCIKDNGSQWLSSSLPLTASTLITQVKNLWESDFNLTSDLLLKTETVQQYTNSNTFPPLLASLVLGAFKMQTDIVEFMETLKERPGHLKPAGNDISVEVSNDVRFSIGRYTVVGQDLMKLNKSSWLDDSVIHAYLYLLEDRFSKEGTKIFILECFVAEFWEKKNYGECLYKEVALVEYTWILMPMCRHSHWILLAANIRNGDVCVINSIPSEDTQRNILQHWRAYMACRSRETKENLSTWREIQCPVFPQTDGNSCGVHILMAAEALLSGVCPAVMRNCHVSGYREFVKHQLLDAAEMHTNDNEEINVHSPEEVEIIEIPIDTSASKQDVEAEDFRKRTSTQTSVIDVHNQSVICEELVGDISNIEVEPSTVTTHERLDKCGGLTDNTNIIVTESIHISENTGSMEITATSDMVPSEPHDTTPGLCPEDIRSYCEELFQNQKSSFVGLTLVCFMKGRLPLTALDDQENTSPLKDYIKWGCQLCNCEATTNAEIRNAFLGLEKLVLTSEQNSLVILRNTDIKRALSTVIADHLQEYIDIIDLKFIFFHIRVNEQDGGFYVCLKGKMVEDLARRFAKEVLQSNLALVLSHDSFGYFHFNLLFLKAVKRQLKSDDIQIILENSDSTFGGTFIHWMCFGRNAELFKSLSFCLTANQKAACLTPCCISGNSNIVQLLCIETDLTDCLRNPKSRLTLPGIAQNMESPLTNIESYDTHALPALHLSSLYGHTGVVSNLLENGFDVNAQLVEGSGTNIPFLPMSTAALAAATKGNIDVVKCLIQHGADLNLHDIMFNAPIHSACRSGNRDLVALIARQCCISEGDAEGNTPLHIACKRGESDNVSILLERGADCTVLNYNNEMPLDIVCKEGFLDVAKVILNQRGYPLPYDGSNTPLHKACAAGFSDIIELLLQYDADRSVTVDDQNPLLTAAYSNNADVVKILLNTSAANIVICDSKIVSECLEKGHIGVVKILLEKGACVKGRGRYGHSLLAKACEKGDIEIVKLLLEKGASVADIFRYRYSPMARPFEKGDIEIVKLLLEKGESVTDIDMDRYSPLARACKKGYIEIVKLLLEKGASVTDFDRYRYSPLAKACGKGDTEIVKLLLEKGASLTDTDLDNYSPLAKACEKGDIEIVKLLLEKGASVTDLDMDGYSLLVTACEKGDIEIVKLLLEKGACVTNVDMDDYSPLAIACEKGDIEMVKLLLEKGAAETDLDMVGNSRLVIPCQKGDIEIVKLLLENGASVTDFDMDGYSPLARACEKGDIEIVRLLLEKGASVNDIDMDDYSALAKACEKGDIEIVKLLLEEGASVTGLEMGEPSLLAIPCEKGDIEIVKLLLEKGASLTAIDLHGYSPLARACEKGDIEIVKLLLEKGASLTDIDMDDYSPLARACEKGDIEIVKLLLEKGASVTDIDRYGYSPLARACEKGDIEMVKLLLEKGASVTAIDRYGYSPLARACQKGDIEIVKLLLEKGESVTAIDRYGYLPLARACQKGDIEIVKLLLEKGASVTAIDMDGYSPLARACKKGDIEIVKLLLEKGASVTAIDRYRYLPLAIACEKGDMEIVKLLLEKGASVTAIDMHGYSPLATACQEGYIEIVKLLLVKTASVSDTVLDKYSPLARACEKGHIEIVKLLLEKRLSVSDTDIDGYLPLVTACGKGVCVSTVYHFFRLSIKRLQLDVTRNIDISSFLKRVLQKKHFIMFRMLLPILPSDVSPEFFLQELCCLDSPQVLLLLTEMCNGICLQNTLTAAEDLKNVKCIEILNLLNTYDVKGILLHRVVACGYMNLVKRYFEKFPSSHHADSCVMIASRYGHTAIVEWLLHKYSNDMTCRELFGRCSIQTLFDDISESSVTEYRKDTTSLFEACYQGHTNIVRLLLQYEMYMSDQAVSSSFHLVCERGNIGVLHLLLDSGLYVDHVDETGSTGLYICSRNARDSAVQVLLENGANPCHVNNEGETPLHAAMESNNFTVMKSLLRYTTSFSNVPVSMLNNGYLFKLVSENIHEKSLAAVDSDSNSLLHHAVRFGFPDSVATLLERGVDGSLTNCKKETAMHIAAERGCRKSVRLLIRYHHTSNVENMDKQTPLHCAASEGHLNIVKDLIDCDSNVSLKGCLHYAAKSGHVETVQCLINKGAVINETYCQSDTPLHHACESGNIQTVNVLLSSRADVNAQGHKGRTPLHIACARGYDGIVDCLLNHGADPNLRNKFNNTSLLSAVVEGHLDVIKVMMIKGAKAEISGANGSNYLIACCTRGHLHVARYLIENGANISSIGLQCISPFSVSLSDILEDERETIEDIQNTVRSGIEGMTSLHAAMDGNHFDVAEYLMNQGADVLENDQYGKSVLMKICEKGNLQVTKAFLSSGSVFPSVLRKHIIKGFTLQKTQTSSQCEKKSSDSVAVRETGHVIEVIDEPDTDSVNVPPVKVACDCDHGDVASLLIAYSAGWLSDMDDSHLYDGKSPLHLAYDAGFMDVVACLLSSATNSNAVDSNGHTIFHKACEHGDVKTLQNILKFNVEIKQQLFIKSKDGEMLSHITSRRGHLHILQMLLEAGMDLDHLTDEGDNVLHLACSYDKYRVCTFLLDTSPNLAWVKNHNGFTPLDMAIGTGNDKIVRIFFAHAKLTQYGRMQNTIWMYLCESMDNINRLNVLVRCSNVMEMTDNHGNTPFHIAAMTGSTRAIDCLLKHDRKDCVKLSNSDGDTPLHVASHQGHSAVVRILSPNFETNVANNLGDTPLHVSCLNAQRGSVLTLLSADSNVNAENNCGDTPLHMVLHSFFTMPDAKLAETIRIIHHLLAYAADPCCQNINRNTPLHVACSLGKIEIVASLLTYYKDLNIMNRCGKTPLHVACEYDHSAIVDLLLELIWLRTLQNGDGGVYVDYQDIESATSLHIACRRNSVQSVSLLLEHGAGTTIKDNNGNMPVFVACEAGCVQVVRQLLPYSSHQDVNRFGETLLLVACRNGHEDMFQIIVHWVYHGADQNMARWFLNVPVPIHMNMTALHISSHIKNVHFVEQLLLRGAAPNTRDVHGQTALHYSCINACRVIVSVLLKYMADVSVCDEHLRTPLHYACERGSLDIAEMLVMAGGNLYVRDRDGRTPLDMCSTGHRVLLKQSLRYLRKRQSTSSEDSPCSSKRIRYDSTKRGCTFEDAQTCPRPRSVPQLRRSHSMGETRCVSSDGQCFQE